ncbi:alginate export family protein [Luteolibacter arcticus]|uniref:Alginate export family protein n=1 Tax=Luteolibacter arcticus TaxID=1581411 RepID=A0ABT3GN89_9BACT|nr:alginate export family protein [Luteolibacter arcticus]MCW1924972.1 alginate export family protein [Luteolibacter arcticus]
MKHHLTSLLALAATTVIAEAGTPAPSPEIAAATEAPWITPLVDIRLRYEFADVDGLDPSHALTIRERLGFKTKAWHGFSLLAEGEFTQAIVDDYYGGAPGVDPNDVRNSFINDPENAELNQAYLQYTGFDTTVKIGRQRIIYDNAAFIGNVGWRQNEQTYDAVSLSNTSIPGLTLNYSYVDQVNRVFGEDATGIFENAPGEIHLFNASYTGIKGVTLGGYIYDMSFDDGVTVGWDNQTYGVSGKGTVAGLTLYGELAYQDEAGPLNNEEGLYAHFNVTKAFGTQSLVVGVEHLDAGVQTPLCTVHVFNGYADATDARRINGTHGGLTDTYVSYMVPIFCGIKWTNAVHLFGDNAISNDLGFGVDSVLAKKFDDHFTAIGKLGYFDTSDALYKSTTRVSVELNYTF